MYYFIIACLCGIAIFWQDIKTREIHILPVLLLAGSGLLFHWKKLGKTALLSFGINLSFVACMLLCVLVIYRLKGEKQIMDRMLGWGDIVTLAALAAWMEPPRFLFFYTAATVLIATAFGMLRWVGRVDPAYPIPLAGWLSLLFNCYLTYYFLV